MDTEMWNNLEYLEWNASQQEWMGMVRSNDAPDRGTDYDNSLGVLDDEKNYYVIRLT